MSKEIEKQLRIMNQLKIIELRTKLNYTDGELRPELNMIERELLGNGV